MGVASSQELSLKGARICWCVCVCVCLRVCVCVCVCGCVCVSLCCWEWFGVVLCLFFMLVNWFSLLFGGLFVPLFVWFLGLGLLWRGLVSSSVCLLDCLPVYSFVGGFARCCGCVCGCVRVSSVTSSASANRAAHRIESYPCQFGCCLK